MSSATSRRQISIAGLSVNSKIVVDGYEGSIGVQPTLAAAKTGTLTTRTDNDTGVATMDSGHGFATNDVLDVYWDGGARYGMTATVSTNAVTIDGGAGDNLPTTSTALTVMKQVVLSQPFDGSKVKALALHCKETRCTILFYESSSLRLAVQLNADTPYEWFSGGYGSNPLASYTAITAIKMTHADSSAEQAITAGFLLDL
jgi:hypothetical protein